MKNYEMMKVLLVEELENGVKYEYGILPDGHYGYTRYEKYNGAWKRLGGEYNYSKDCLEWEFEITLTA